MAVVGTAKLVWDGWAASSVWGRQIEFTCIYEVTVDSASDGPVIVDGASGLPRLGDAYAAGNDGDTATFCHRKSYSRSSDRTALLWRVTCVFGPVDLTSPGGTIGLDRDGRPTDDPLVELLPFRTGQYTRSIPVTKAKNVDRVGSRWADTEGPVTNSAGVVFDPPPEMDYSIMLLYVSARTLSVPDGIIPDYYNAINADDFEMERAGARFLGAPYIAKINDIGLSYNVGRNNQLYWQWDFVIALDPIFGWRPEYVDRGFEARAEVGDPDGRGSTIGTSDIKEGQPKVRVLTDFDGQALQQPVLLNGLGQPLDLDQPAVYLKYKVYPELSFENLINTFHLYE